MPDIGALDPEPIEKSKNDEEEKKIDLIRKKARLLPIRLIEGTRRRDFPDVTPNDLLNME